MGGDYNGKKIKSPKDASAAAVDFDFTDFGFLLYCQLFTR
jgi:hypothetical protein